MEKILTGRIMKASGGFYYVDTPDGVYECRARGLFRKEDVSPYVGDFAGIQAMDNHKGYIVTLEERRNQLLRPPLCNIDRLALVCSIVDPVPSLLVLDKLIAIAEYKDIEPVIVITKSDLADCGAMEETYQKTGLPVFVISSETMEGLEPLRRELSHGVTAFCGNSGVGKSSLLNALDARFALETAHTSKKLGRGRHTTRHVELYPFGEHGYIADTPGFSSVETDRFERITKEQLPHCFREFEAHLGGCRFLDCAHMDEPDCTVRAAVAAGEIPRSRYESYRFMYEEAKNIKEWETK